MKEELKKQIVEGLEAWMSAHGVSQNEAAKRSGVNAAYLVEMRRGNWSLKLKEGKTVEFSDRHFEKIAEMIGLELRRTYWETRATDQFVEIVAELDEVSCPEISI
jgi:hypothetical protein